MPRPMTQPERITALEVKMDAIANKQDAIDKKLDELLALRHKGLGAFWLASTLIGTGIIGAILKIFGWLKGVDL